MEELIACKILSPLKVGETFVSPCPSFDLPRSIAESEQRDGRVQILGAAENFTPIEPDQGVVEVAQATDAAAPAPAKRSKKAK